MVTPHIGATPLAEGQEKAATAVNTILTRLEAVVQGNVKDSSPSATPPVSPADGDRYIVPASATGDWAGQDGDVAIYVTGWTFVTPHEGWLMFDQLNDKYVRFDGTNWVDFQAATTTFTGGWTDATAEADFNLLVTRLRDAKLMAP